MASDRAEPHSLALDSIVVSAGRPHGPGDPVNQPIVPTSIYQPGGPFAYAREHNPTWSALEEALGVMEDAHCTAFASGIAAISAVLDLVAPGSVVVAPEHPYSGTGARLAELEAAGTLTVRRVSGADTGALAEAAQGAALVWVESPTNPLLEVTDIAEVARAAHAAGALVAVDNTFATVFAQNALDLGADISMQSATKYIGGHSDLLMGVTTCRSPELAERLRHRRTMLGATPGVLEAWLALRGLRTMALRVPRANASAHELACRLESHPAVERVMYPLLPSHPQHELAARQMRLGGAIVSFTVAGGADAAQAACDRVRLITQATSLGGVETTMERRARHALEHPATPASLIRMSVGIEAVDDLWADLDQAIRGSAG
ncbi:MAG: PLP-dependent transferase [Actinomycetales bacterium]|nr:PLP-dependent transferase [Actinomycetales bacterium]